MKNIALLMRPDSGYYRGVLRGIKRYAEESAQWIFGMVANTRDVPVMLQTFRPDGILAFTYLEETPEKLSRMDIPVVSFANTAEGLTLPMVSVDDVAVGRMAADYYINRGFRHFAFVGCPRFRYSNQREQGFRQRAIESGGTYHCFQDPSYPDAASVWAWKAAPEICRWLESLPRETGLLGANDAVALRLSELARQNGIRVPEDLAMLGVDDDDLFCTLSHPHLSSVATPMEQIGYRAAQLLDQLMHKVKPPATCVLLAPTEVVTRQSSDVLAIDDPELASAIRYMHQNAHRPIGIKQVLAEVPMSRRALERRCKEAIGRTPLEELLRVRILHVQHLLVNTSKPISQIARESGFSSNKQLSMTFKQQTGQTATAYRRRMRS